MMNNQNVEIIKLVMYFLLKAYIFIISILYWQSLNTPEETIVLLFQLFIYLK